MAIVEASPASAYSRRIWFLYEWLLDTQLDLPPATASGPYAQIVDPKLQWAVKGSTSSRHRVRNNLPGTRLFCPMVWRTDALDGFVAANLAQGTREAVARIPRAVRARTAASLLLKESKSSYAIEGEFPAHNRIQRWGRAIGEAGQYPLDTDELLRLQSIVIGDSRFVHLGLRDEGGFVGEHDRTTHYPLPDHISARPEDLPDLMCRQIQRVSCNEVKRRPKVSGIFLVRSASKNVKFIPTEYDRNSGGFFAYMAKAQSQTVRWCDGCDGVTA